MAIYGARDIAAELRRRQPGIGVKKLHKLLYYCQGHHLGTLGQTLFAEDFQAWDRGPVLASLWRAERYELPPAAVSVAFDQGTLNTIGYVLSRYGAMTGADLEALTHSETPWILADVRRANGGSQVMAKDEIRAFFEQHQPSDESDDLEDDPVDPELARSWLSGAPARLNDELSVDDRAALLALAQR